MPLEAEELLYLRIEDAISAVEHFGLFGQDQKELLKDRFHSFYEGVFENYTFTYDGDEPYDNH